MSFDPNVAQADKQIQCIDCGTPVTITVGEQKFYADKGLQEPKRCKPCRDKKKAERLSHDARGGYSDNPVGRGGGRDR